MGENATNVADTDVRRSNGRRGRTSAAPTRVALLIESSRAFGRGVLEEIAECLRERRWMITYQEGGLSELLPGLESGRGLSSRIEDGGCAGAGAKACAGRRPSRRLSARRAGGDPDDADCAIGGAREKRFRHSPTAATSAAEIPNCVPWSSPDSSGRRTALPPVQVPVLAVRAQNSTAGRGSI
jgi:hypothetical protein